MWLQEHGASKYGADSPLACSAVAGWRGIAVEHRRHPRGELPSFRPEHMEIGIATGCHPDCVVSRTGDRLRQHTRVEPGTIWFCPVGVLEEDICISDWHDVLHVYLPPERFAELSESRCGAAASPQSVHYRGGIYDERIRRIGDALLGQLHAPGAGGAVLIDTLALELTACLVDRHSSDARSSRTCDAGHRLDVRRVRRVLDFMAAHIEDEVGLSNLAEAACLSPFHFSRAFAATLGVPPHRYLSNMRLERAKTLLSLGATPIAEVAVACCFSSQSNFTRAFRRATGATPAAFQRAWLA
jgi:AraC family transcriptional regulator